MFVCLFVFHLFFVVNNCSLGCIGLCSHLFDVVIVISGAHGVIADFIATLYGSNEFLRY